MKNTRIKMPAAILNILVVGSTSDMPNIVAGIAAKDTSQLRPKYNFRQIFRVEKLAIKASDSKWSLDGG